MIEVLKKTITISTTEGDYHLTFCPAVPRGYKALQTTITKHIEEQNMARAIAKEDKISGAVQWIVKQSELAEDYINAIDEAVDDTFNAYDILRHISLDDLSTIAVALLNEYNSYFNERMDSIQEGFEP